MYLSRLLLALGLALTLTPAYAHEYWIAPEKYQVQPGEAIRGTFRNGEEFKGVALAFFTKTTVNFIEVFEGKGTRLTPRPGDSSALQITAPEKEGLLTVIYETTPSIVTYKEWEKFLAFTKHKDFPNAEADHIAAGWSQDIIKETYTRHIKTLIAVGDGKGEDAKLGMTTEFVALTNPYTDDLADGMKVALYYDGAPRADAQVEVFDRAPDESVTITLHRTDAEGVASIPVIAGHEYLFDGVVLRKADGGGTTPDAPVWQTLWAALTFRVPD